MIKTEIINYTIGTRTIPLCVPNNHDLFYQYKINNTFELFPNNALKNNFPYWAKVWHSAIGLSEFLQENSHYVKNKNVVEIAAGLGLPSIVASKYAATVICSDYIIEALHYIQQSIALNKISNCTTQLVDWNNVPTTIEMDVLLMSDVNYESQEFNVLYQLFMVLLQQGKTILLATPQRLVAKDFIKKIIPYCIVNKEMEIEIAEEKSFVNVMVLQQLT